MKSRALWNYMAIPNITESSKFYVLWHCSGWHSFLCRNSLFQARCLESGHNNSMSATTWPCCIRHTSFSNIIHIADETLGWSVATNTGGLSVPAHRLSQQSLPTVRRSIIMLRNAKSHSGTNVRSFADSCRHIVIVAALIINRTFIVP